MNQIKIPILDLKPQYQTIKAEIHQAIDRVLESGRYILGTEVQQFEEEVAFYLGVKHAIGVNSGTDALVIGLRSAGIQERDEVITTPFSFFATAESISNVGAIPIFADVEANSFNINPDAIRKQITPHTKAILPVHLYGQPAAMGQIMELAEEYDLKVIEDCAQSFGARYYGNCPSCQGSCLEKTRKELYGKQTGTMGDVGAFSFFPSKNLGAYGDGGLIVTNNDAIAQTAKMLRAHGARKKYHNEVLGYNSRLDAIQAAILQVKLPYIDQWNQGRFRVAKRYNELLVDIADVMLPELVEGHVFHQYTVRILGGKRDRVQEKLAAAGIGTMVYYPVPQDRLPVYEGQYPTSNVSEMLAKQVLSLPIWAELDDALVEQVAWELKCYLKD
ncbi:MAG: erythromycin biosynthesis sensory transduction protein eryC1 [Cyanobacteria bacterium]|jgi:dTDP-4-amino-4,6-dideoxygalactose transaminase|nr:erythromycin biosynthesis sensory transduction protein eryC1 [Cyanobacteria bacterium GSL.Bin21]